MRQVDGFSVGTPISSNNNTDRHDIAEILLKVALNTITLEIERSASQLHKWTLPMLSCCVALPVNRPSYSKPNMYN